MQLKEHGNLRGVCSALYLLGKPGIVAAVTLSGCAGMVLTAKGLPDAQTAVSCAASLCLMALGAALTNSVLDRCMDRRMERLKRRSAALDRLGAGPVLASAAAVTGAALVIASTALNAAVVLLLLAASLSYVICYTLLLKPHTHWAAVLGGLPGALPVVIGSAAVASPLDRSSLSLFLVLLLWQPPHFWLLALCRSDEYRAAGVPVLPLIKGVAITRRCTWLCVLALIPASLLPWWIGPCSNGYALCALPLGVSLLAACRYYLRDGLDCRPAFQGSIAYLLVLLLVIIVDLAL